MRPSRAVLLVLALSLAGRTGGDRSDDSSGAASPGQVPRPAPGRCEPVPESADGRYVVADAGEVTLRLEDGAVQLAVSSSDGWRVTAAHSPVMAVVTFTRNDEKLVLEAERVSGRLVIRICDDAG
jgi:hypothetical protein